MFYVSTRFISTARMTCQTNLVRHIGNPNGGDCRLNKSTLLSRRQFSYVPDGLKAADGFLYIMPAKRTAEDLKTRAEDLFLFIQGRELVHHAGGRIVVVFDV